MSGGEKRARIEGDAADRDDSYPGANRVEIGFDGVNRNESASTALGKMSFPVPLVARDERGRVVYCRLKSFSAPHTFYNLGGKVFVFTDTTGEHSATITQQHYNDTGELLTELDSIVTAAGNGTATFTFNDQTNKLTMAYTEAFQVNVTAANTAARALGFAVTTANDANNKAADNALELVVGGMLYLRLTGGLQRSGSTARGSDGVLGAIPVNGGIGEIITWSGQGTWYPFNRQVPNTLQFEVVNDEDQVVNFQGKTPSWSLEFDFPQN